MYRLYIHHYTKPNDISFDTPNTVWYKRLIKIDKFGNVTDWFSLDWKIRGQPGQIEIYDNYCVRAVYVVRFDR